MAQEQDTQLGHGHGHGHHEDRQLARIFDELRIIRTAVGLIQRSAGASQGGIEEILKQMATLDEQLKALAENLDTATTKLGTDLDTLIAAFKAAGNITPAQQALLDQASGISGKLKDLDDKTVAATAQEPPIVVP